MEAMAMQRVVLAPSITGLPELISDRQTGFLYQQNSLADFVDKLISIAAAKPSLENLGRQARRRIHTYFNRQRNLHIWADDFLLQLERHLTKTRKLPCESCTATSTTSGSAGPKHTCLRLWT
jgi:glycosyltransferase involved in cell wall biosynthesis